MRQWRHLNAEVIALGTAERRARRTPSRASAAAGLGDYARLGRATPYIGPARRTRGSRARTFANFIDGPPADSDKMFMRAEEQYASIDRPKMSPRSRSEVEGW